jgi:hypothetical protein
MLANMARLEKLRQEDTSEVVDTSDLPPTLALTTFALGPLRGLIVDGLWWRLIQLHDSGNFFETMQLTKWITRLQPRFPAVWAYHGWNLSYNVAYEFGEREIRWKWIERSISLLRDEALRYNPGNVTIRKELARIFFDRLGSRGDEAYDYFCWQWASKIMRYMPKGSRPELEVLTKAPRTVQELLTDQAVAELVASAKLQGVDLTDPKLALAPLSQPLLELTGKAPEAWNKLQLFCRASGLRTELKLDPEHMLWIDREFGPFDWRLPQAHVVYWLIDREETYQDYLSKQAGPEHMVRQAMMQSFLNGRLIYNPKTNFFMTTNNLAIIGRIHDYFAYCYQYNYSDTMDRLHADFLRDGIAILYSYNHQKSARTLYEHYQEHYHKEGTPEVPFEDFVAAEMHRVLRGQTYNDERSIVNASLFQAYIWLGAGDVDRARGYTRMAYMIWQRHQKRFDKNPKAQFPTFERMKQTALSSVLQSNVGEALKGQVRQQTAVADIDMTADTPDIYLGDFEDAEHHHKEQRKNEQQKAAERE